MFEPEPKTDTLYPKLKFEISTLPVNECNYGANFPKNQTSSPKNEG